MSALRLQAIEHIADVEPTQWDALVAASGGSVLNQHAFLQAFETSESVAPDTGWQPRHLLLWEDEQLVAAIPLYAKGHSYGEFVFDWAWAEAYQRNGLEYYPKWLSAIPFTPVPGSRLLTTEPYRALAAAALLQWAKKSGLSSLHVLYTTPEDTEALLDAGCMRRTHTQFHWYNRDWPDFETFLASLTQPKRKKIRAERRKVREAGVTTDVRSGAQITPEDWAFFYRCYANTYHMRGNTPYLTPEFFLTVGQTLSEHCVMAVATRRDQPIAASLLWLDTVNGQRKLYGRYWGALEHVDCLHFELAYYTPLEWALANSIDVVEGGAQGEHKLARGFEPVQTQSVHWLAHPGFADAVEKFLERERAGVDNYLGSLSSPFRGEVGD
jgi:predicted N-acyltransferase